MIFETERLLEDNYPVYGDYVYLVNGKLTRCDLMTGNVLNFKKDLISNEYSSFYKMNIDELEVRNCDLIKRNNS